MARAPRVKLTERMVAAIPDNAPGKESWVMDAEVPKFGIRVVGDRKWYAIRYNVAGKTTRVHLGPVVPGSLADKRKQARAQLQILDEGKDPAREKKALAAERRGAVTVGELVPLFLDDAETRLRHSTYRQYRLYLTGRWKPVHSTPVRDLNRDDVNNTLAKIVKDVSPATADHARTAMVAFLSWCMDQRHVDLNIALAVKNPDPGKRARQREARQGLSDDAIREIWTAAGEYGDYGKIVRLLLLTGQRLGEISALRWSWINRSERIVTLPGSKTKNGYTHVVPLSDDALAIIDSRPRFEKRDPIFGEGDNGYVGWSNGKEGLDKLILKARRETDPEAEPLKWVNHDLRHTAITRMKRLGFKTLHVEKTVNHQSGEAAGVAGLYDHNEYLDEKRQILDAWAERLRQIVSGQPANVIPLTRAAETAAESVSA